MFDRWRRRLCNAEVFMAGKRQHSPRAKKQPLSLLSLNHRNIIRWIIHREQRRMNIVRISKPETAMNHPIADARKPEPTGLAVPGSSLTLRVRFVAGMAITLGGAGVLVSDLLHLVPSFG